MLIRIKNAYASKHQAVIIPLSKVKMALASILKKEGYISNYQESSYEKKKFIKINLRYVNQKPVILDLKRLSSPGRRIYVGKDYVPRRLGGIAIISTSKGLKTTREIKKEGLGGELLCEIW
jgi:small subunit ribosomal protein S8